MISQSYHFKFLKSAWLAFVLVASLTSVAHAQKSQELVSCKPLSQKTGELGCWIVASTSLGPLDAPVYWTLDTFPAKEAAERAKGPAGTAVDALGKVWLFTIGPKSETRASGTRVAEIGPLPVRAGQRYTAQFMEATLKPGMVSRTHVHSGTEAFYTESGETCLETPEGKQIGRKGVNVIIPEAVPMELTATGSETRTGLMLVLHDASKPATAPVANWKSKGLCEHDSAEQVEKTLLPSARQSQVEELAALNELANQFEVASVVPGLPTFMRPEIRLDTIPPFSFYSYKTHIVHEARYKALPPPVQETFNLWASYTKDQSSGHSLFDDMFHCYFFVHELGHWLSTQVIQALPDVKKKTVFESFERHPYETEIVANRLAVAWYREHDPAYLARLIEDFRAIRSKLPNPVPTGQGKREYFDANYEKLWDSADAYGWFQLDMVLTVYEGTHETYQQVLADLPKVSYSSEATEVDSQPGTTHLAQIRKKPRRFRSPPVLWAKAPNRET